MIDTHIHLNFDNYMDDLDMCIIHAEDIGVSKMIVIGIDASSSDQAVILSEQFPSLYASVGIHPSYLEEDVTFIKTLIGHEKVVAIGECGIDLFHTQSNIKQQKEIFLKQIKLAIEYDKPIIIHSRDAVKECIDIVKPFKGQLKGVFHCFAGTVEQALEVVELGFYIGVNGPITFKNAVDAKAIVKAVDLKYILTETDGPYLAPEPYRGRRNVPENIKYIVKGIAQIKGLSVSEVDKITTDNAHDLFKF
jgi:TatD DNase family protein